MSGTIGRLGRESSTPATPRQHTFEKLSAPVCKYEAGLEVKPVPSERNILGIVLHGIAIALSLAILLALLSGKAHGQGSVNQNTYDSQGQLKVLCSGCSAASSVTINDPSITTQKAAVSAGGNLAVECKVGCAGGATTPTDAFANPTTAGLSFDFLALWNGATWDRWKGDATNGAFVNVKTSVLPTGAAADSSLTTIDADLKANITLHAGGNVIGGVTIADGSDATLGAKADAKSAATDTTAITIMQVLKEISAMAQAPAALPANQSVNTAQIGGTAVVADPCQANAKVYLPISLTSSTQLISGTSAKKVYICAMILFSASADNIALVEGTGSVCATSIAGMSGGTTAATGWNLAANGGLTFGNGTGAVIAESVNADNVCLLVSGATQVSGSIAYVVQ